MEGLNQITGDLIISIDEDALNVALPNGYAKTIKRQ